MTRLIDADVLAKWLDKEHYVDRPSGKCDERQNRVLGIAISALKNPQIAPTIDAEPVRHGRWEWHEEWGLSTWLEPPELVDAYWVCSACGTDLLQYLKSHFLTFHRIRNVLKKCLHWNDAPAAARRWTEVHPMENKSIGYRSLVWLNREQKQAKNALWSAIERKAPQADIENLRRKQVALDWLTGVAIKEDDATR